MQAGRDGGHGLALFIELPRSGPIERSGAGREFPGSLGARPPATIEMNRRALRRLWVGRAVCGRRACWSLPIGGDHLIEAGQEGRHALPLGPEGLEEFAREDCARVSGGHGTGSASRGLSREFWGAFGGTTEHACGRVLS